MRCLLIVLDSVGVGQALDAGDYGDVGADTLGHLVATTGLRLPALWSLGLGRIMGSEGAPAGASWGRMRPRTAGKDSTTGHWEIAGVELAQPFAVFEHFPPALAQAIEAEAGIRCLGNLPASGTQIIAELGGEHCRTDRPILYTSANSVLQIAANESAVPVERLMEICTVARRHADRWHIGRVIARPYMGQEGDFHRTPRRHDFATQPPPTILDALDRAGLPVKAVGKIADLFAGRGVAET